MGKTRTDELALGLVGLVMIFMLMEAGKAASTQSWLGVGFGLVLLGAAVLMRWRGAEILRIITAAFGLVSLGLAVLFLLA